MPFQNPFGAVGTVPAFSPQFQGNLRARYDWTIGDYKAYVMVGANYTGSMFNQPATYTSGNARDHARHDLSALRAAGLHHLRCGVRRSQGQLDARRSSARTWATRDASMFTSSAQFIKSEVPLRPRVIGLKIGYKF